jgi:hypothetical protein
MSTNEVLAQMMENISYPTYRIRHARVAIQWWQIQVGRERLRHQSRDFMPGVVVEPHLVPEAAQSYAPKQAFGHFVEPSKAIVGPNSGALLLRL